MKKTTIIIISVVAVIVLVCAATVLFRRGSFEYSGLLTVRADCAALSNSPSASYSATIIAKQDMKAAADAEDALLRKYQGDVTSRSDSSESYQTGSKSSDYVTVSVISFEATLPLQNADAFMKDMRDNASAAGNKLIGVSYEKMTGAQTKQDCVDDEVGARIAQANAKLYLSELPFILKHYAVSTTSNAGAFQDIDNLNGQIQDSYSQISNYGDSIGLLFRNMNEVSVSVAIQDRENPQPYYSADAPDAATPTTSPLGE